MVTTGHELPSAEHSATRASSLRQVGAGQFAPQQILSAVVESSSQLPLVHSGSDVHVVSLPLRDTHAAPSQYSVVVLAHCVLKHGGPPAVHPAVQPMLHCPAAHEKLPQLVIVDEHVPPPHVNVVARTGPVEHVATPPLHSDEQHTFGEVGLVVVATQKPVAHSASPLQV